MDIFFLICAVVGGTIMVTQVAMTVLGLSGDTGDADVGTEAGLDSGDFDVSADAGDMSPDAGGDAASGHEHGHHGTVWIFKVLTFQTVVAAIAFFGLAGTAARAAEIDPFMSLVVGFGAGLAAMYGVYYLMLSMHKFNADGTVQIARSIGLPGTVYVPIPGANAGAGKIHMKLQNRIVELQAMTSRERLPSGAKIRVVDVLGPDTVSVEPLIETQRTSHA